MRLKKVQLRGENMSEIVSVRVSKDTKEEMEKYKEINWSEVIRKALNEYLEKIRETEALAQSLQLEEEDLEEIKKKVKQRIAKKHEV